MGARPSPCSQVNLLGGTVARSKGTRSSAIPQSLHPLAAPVDRGPWTGCVVQLGRGLRETPRVASALDSRADTREAGGLKRRRLRCRGDCGLR